MPLCNNAIEAIKADEARRVYLEALDRLKCQCGRVKQRGNSLCSKCYWRLPRAMRRDLYRKMGQGYEAAYDAAVQFLNVG